MEPTFAVAVALVALFGLLAAGVPVSISLGASGIFGTLLVGGFRVANSLIAGTTYSAVGKESYLIIPMFILMGMLTLHSGIAPQLFAIAAKLLKWLPGGLGMATVFASAGFGAISGSSLATIATLGRTSITEMTRHGYQRSFAAATVAVSGTLSVLIPPSIILVFYGIMTGESIGSLLIAGIIPGILSAVFLAAFIGFRAIRNPSLVNADIRAEKELARVGAGAKLGRIESELQLDEGSGEEAMKLTFASGARAIGGIVVLFSIVVGGIYTGVFTPMESASIGAFAAAVLICVQFLRTPRLLAKKLKDALLETSSMTGMIFMIVIGAGFFSYFLVSAGVPTAITKFALSLEVSPLLTVICLLLILIPAGMFLDSMSLLIITVPLLYAPITALGFDGIWLGILVVKLIEFGMITPPVGMNVFVTAGTIKKLGVEEVFRGVFPFFVAEALLIAIIFAFPAISTWLPSLAGL